MSAFPWRPGFSVCLNALSTLTCCCSLLFCTSQFGHHLLQEAVHDHQAFSLLGCGLSNAGWPLLVPHCSVSVELLGLEGSSPAASLPLPACLLGQHDPCTASACWLSTKSDWSARLGTHDMGSTGQGGGLWPRQGPHSSCISSRSWL
jgi:hypothetical protein